MTFPVLAAATTIMALVLGVVWAKYTAHIAAGNPYRAAFYDALIVTMGGFNLLAITEDPRVLFFSVLGSTVGTYLSVKR